MTLSATYEPRRQQGNGITKEFSYSFDPYSLEALKVYIEENGVQTETQDYAATADENGGIVTFNVAPTSEQYVVIARSVPQDQEVPFYTSSGFDAGVVENCFDKLTAMVQEVNNEAVRSAKLPKGYNINLELPVPESGKGLYWNNEGTGFQNSRLNLDDVETLTKSYRDQSLAARDEAVASSTRAVNTVKEATDLLANTQTYVDEAVVTIDTAVNDAKTTIIETSEEAKETINGYVSNAEENVRQIAQEEANKAIEDAAATATGIVVEYANNEIKPVLNEIASNAAESAELAAKSANESAVYSTDSQHYAEDARIWAEGEQAEVQELGGELSSKGWANIAKDRADVAGASADRAERIAQGFDGVVNTIEGSIGDIGFAPLGIDEAQNKRRYLNGQVISQAQFVSFTNKIKSAIELYPNLVTSETNWQAEVTNSKLGQCGKFVIDDVAGTIRLPKVVNINGLADLALMGSIKTESLPNISGKTNETFIRTNSTSQDTVLSGCITGIYNASDSTYGTSGNKTLRDIGIDASLSSSTYQDNAPVQQEAIQYPYFIQVATGVEETVDVTREIELNNPFSLLDYKWSEYELNNASWLLSNGAFHSGATYVSVYELLLKIYNGTETKEGVSVKLVSEEYSDSDFVINTADTTFRLPVKVKLASGNAVVGNGMILGLTNGSRNYGLNCGVSSNNQALGIRTDSYGSNLPKHYGEVGESVQGAIGITTDPTKSGIETSSNGLKLYFYVGETIQDANVVNASGVLTAIANADYVVETYKNGADWYRIYKSGWIEQGSITGGIAQSGASTINLLKPFADTSYHIQGNTINGKVYTTYGFAILSKTTTNFSCDWANANAGDGTYWFACGYGA